MNVKLRKSTKRILNIRELYEWQCATGLSTSIIYFNPPKALVSGYHDINFSIKKEIRL